VPERRRPLVEAWLKSINQPDLLSREMTAPLARDFRRWLLTDYGHVKSGAHANKCARLLSECISCAVERSALAVHPFTKLKLPKVKKSQLVYLTTEQLQQIIRAELPNSGLRRTRDAFLLMCYTGMAWVDARAFDPGLHLTTDMKGQQWLRRPRTKTEVEAIIPLLPAAQVLLDKYKAEGRVPIPSNQKMNERLREIAALLHLPLRLTCHVGRRTFGMLALDAGVSLESVSAMLGHASIRITQELYAKVKEGRIGREMRDAGLL
jgi:integrase